MGKSLKGKELGKGISQRPDGLYVARKMIDGKTVSVANKSLTELRKQFKEAVEKEKSFLSGRMTFQDWYDVWFENVKKPKMKCDLSAAKFKYEYDKTYPPIIGDYRLEDIQQLNIQSATNEMISNGTGYASVRIALITTNQIFKYALANGIIRLNPCTNVVVDDRNKKERPSYAMNDLTLNLFFRAIKDHAGEEMFRFMLYSGVRVGELVSLMWDDVDFEKGLIHIRRSLVTFCVDGHMQYRFVRPKSNSGIRAIPFIGGMRELLNEWKPIRDKIHEELISGGVEGYEERFRDLVFIVKKTGHPYSKEIVTGAIHRNQKRMERIAKKEGYDIKEIQPVRSHLFRHTFATKCFEAGFAPRTVQHLLGHDSYVVTCKYTHITDSFIDDEIKKVNGLLDF